MRFSWLYLVFLFASAAVGQDCAPAPFAGFRVSEMGGVKTALWYPSGAPEAPYTYSRLAPEGSVAVNAPLATCRQYPLVVFSHGLNGCGIQSAVFTEELARRGYIVAAPDHRDAGCSSQGGRESGGLPANAFSHPSAWTDQTYADRKADIQNLLSALLGSADFGAAIDSARIAGAGHSLGGYAMFGLAGGWESWRDVRLKTLLLFSPYTAPFLTHGRVRGVTVPVMYQGGDMDLANTPVLRMRNGVYDSSNAPAYYVEFRKQSHLDWTNQTCAGSKTLKACIAEKERVRMITQYGIWFLDRYMKNPETHEKSLASFPSRSAFVSDYRSKEK